jgi:thiol-disulfide isomerase/thioredoxin
MNERAPKFSEKDYKGNIVFIDFWASWCAPCQQELPELEKLAADYKGKKIKIFAINVDQNRKEGEALLRKLGLTSSAFHILWDSKSKVVSAYNIDSMPSSFIIDSRGIIRFVHHGFRTQDPPVWRQEISSLLHS